MARRIQFVRKTPAAKELRRKAGTWLKELRARAGLSQIELAEQLNLKYYTFVAQVENGFGRVPTESMEAWGARSGWSSRRSRAACCPTTIRSCIDCCSR